VDSLAMYSLNLEAAVSLPARMASTKRELQRDVAFGVSGTR
jgi:hypothetical protein